MNEDVESYCFSGVLHWNPKACKVCFNVEHNSWNRLFNNFQLWYCEKYQLSSVSECPLVSRPTFAKIVRTRVFAGLKIGRQPHNSDACDNCVAYWKKKKTYLNWLSVASEGHRDTDGPKKKEEFLAQHCQWKNHLDFAYAERNYYKTQCQIAKQQYKKVEAMIGEGNDVEIQNVLNESWIHISVDAMRIRYLPHIGYGPEAHSLYFMLKMKMYLMGVVDEGMERGHAYIWDQTGGSTTTNHVLTSVWMYLLTYGRGERNLRITMDNCGVNKSYLFVSFAVALVVLEFFQRVELNWLVVGHTKFSPDRLFGIISQVFHDNDFFTKREAASVINNKIGDAVNASVITELFDFAKELEQCFRQNNFLTASGPVGIKSLQGFRVEKTENVVKAWGLKEHSFSSEQKQLLQEMNAKKQNIKNPFDEVMDGILLDFEIPVRPNQTQIIELMTMKKNANSEHLTLPVYGIEWWKLLRVGLRADLLHDLCKASGLVVDNFKTEYEDVFKALSPEQHAFLLKHPKTIIDVSEGTEKAGEKLTKLMEQFQGKEQELDPNVEVEPSDKDGKEKNAEEDTETKNETENIGETLNDEEFIDSAPQDSHVSMFEIQRSKTDSLCFEFSKRIQQIQEAVAKGEDIPRQARERRKKIMMDFE